MENKELQELITEEEDSLLEDFSLDDIMKEFGAEEDAAEAAAVSEAEASPLSDTRELPDLSQVEAVVERQEETAQEETAQEEAVPEAEEEPAPVTEETVRIPDVPSDTIRMEPAALPKGKVTNAQPVDDEADAKEEPYSSKWEPEYEQPIGEYVPPQPIQFQPRSKIRELKRKLVAGPEKRFYELSELGLGKLQFALFLSMIMLGLAAASTVMYAMGLVPENRMRLMVFFQLLSMLVSALLGCFQLIEGFTDVFRKRFTLNTLLVFTFGFCCADAIFCLQQLRVPCCAAFCLEMTMSLWNAYHRRNTEMAQMDTLRKAVRLDGVAKVPEFHNGVKAFGRKEGQVEDFMDNYQKDSTPQRVMNWYALASLLLSLGIGAAAYVLGADWITVIQVISVCLLAAVPATAFITLSRPMNILEKRLHKLGSVICGWPGVVGLKGKAVFPMEHEDLFPAGTVKMNGVKFFGSRDPDQVIAYSTALVTADNGSLAPLFNQVLDSRNGRHYDAEEFRTYPSGIGGVVCEEPVLAGTSAFLKEMGVEVPEGVRVNNAVYVAIDGELCGLFAMSYDRAANTMAGLSTLCAHGRIRPIVTCTDFTLTQDSVKARLGVKPKKLILPERDQRLELAQKQPAEDAPCYAITTRPGVASLAYAVTGARTLRCTSFVGLIIHMLGGIAGLALMAYLVVVGALHLLTPANLFLYQLIWMIPGLLITEWTRGV